MTQQTRAKVGVFSIGLAAYWAQFPGLRERLDGYRRHVETRLGQWADVVSAGLVDTPPAAVEAGRLFARERVDLIVCHAATYATSSQVLPVVQERRLPVLVLNLQPVPAIDYEQADTAELLANCGACCVPEIAGVFARAGIDCNVVSGTLFDDTAAWSDIEAWCQAAGIASAIRRARIGFLGHTYPGMLDLYADFTAIQAQLGTHVELLEIDDLTQRVQSATTEEIAAKIDETERTFTLDADVTRKGMEWGTRVAVGLDRLVQDFDLDGLAYYYRGTPGEPSEQVAAGMILGNTLLTARGIPAAGEGDIKTALAMKLLDSLGAGGSFTEFYAMDFRDDFVLMGHDGPGHIAISDGTPALRELDIFHGKAGGGLAVEFRVQTGPITIVGFTQTRDGRLKLLGAEGESIPGPTMRIGNTNSRIRFPLPPAPFLNAWCAHGPTHHCALGAGHHLAAVEKVARLLGLEFARVG
ncbi:MAG: L-arabinose isomerase family protein [Thermomicrobiales bacterium]